jgi:hypothetical protein
VQWSDKTVGAEQFRDVLAALLRDWGTGLHLQLYEEALAHLVGGETPGLTDVEVRTPGHTLGYQRMRLVAPRVAFALTALREPNRDYESHLRRLLRHTELEAILWANLSLKVVRFTAVT